MRAEGEQRPKESMGRDLGDLVYDSLHEVPDSLACGSASGMTGERFGSLVSDRVGPGLAGADADRFLDG
jgi:hypothetical protein